MVSIPVTISWTNQPWLQIWRSKSHKLQWQYWSSPHQPRRLRCDLCTSHLGSRALRIYTRFFLDSHRMAFFLVFNLHLYWRICFLNYNIARSVGKVVLPFKNIYFALMSWSGQLFPSYMIWLCKLWKIGDLIHTTPPFDVPFLIGNDLTNPNCNTNKHPPKLPCPPQRSHLQRKGSSYNH